jgi:flagellar hook-associated protein 1 FlgK
MSALFTELRSQVSEKITTSTDEVNRIIERITELNNKLTPLVSLGSDAGATIINERARAVEQLSALVGPVNATVDTKGLMSVSVNGASIISTVIGHKVQVSETTSSSGERTLSMQVISRASGDVISKFNPGAGEIASNLKHYNVTLDGSDSSGGFSIVKSLDELAGAIVNKVNTVAQTGYGLDDVTAPNRNIFDPTGTTAASIKLDAAVLNQPRNLPISIEAGTPGDNTIARQIAALADDPTFINAQTAQQFYANTLNRVATAGADAANGAKTTSLVNDQLNAQRESVIGVNLDEEALSLIRYQRAFEAAARIVNTTNELLGTLINLGR